MSRLLFAHLSLLVQQNLVVHAQFTFGHAAQLCLHHNLTSNVSLQYIAYYSVRPTPTLRVQYYNSIINVPAVDMSKLTDSMTSI